MNDTTRNIGDLLVTLLGLVAMGYGVFCAITMKVVIGLRGIHDEELAGTSARILGIIYAVGGFIIASAGFLSWSNPLPSVREQLTSIAIATLLLEGIVSLFATLLSALSRLHKK